MARHPELTKLQMTAVSAMTYRLATQELKRRHIEEYRVIYESFRDEAYRLVMERGLGRASESQTPFDLEDTGEL